MSYRSHYTESQLEPSSKRSHIRRLIRSLRERFIRWVMYEPSKRHPVDDFYSIPIEEAGNDGIDEIMRGPRHRWLWRKLGAHQRWLP